MKFTLPIDLLPTDAEERYQKLQDYFCDQRCHSVSENGHWVIETYWPPKLEYFIDPKIDTGFTWWNSELSPPKVYQQVKDEKEYQLSLHDSWTLYSWSKWLLRQIEKTGIPEEIIILHIDYHNDLMSPRIAYSENQYKDLLTNEVFDLKVPSSVQKAILSGAIGVGSFIVPMLHEIKRVHVRHLCDGPLVNRTRDINVLQKDWESDTMLATNEIRPKIICKTINIEECNKYPIDYKITSDLIEWLSDLPKVPILLHIDMDYFNCRYDGDSDWLNHKSRFDPDYNQIKKKMVDIFSTISKLDLHKQVEDVTIALSPGFFPAEFWPESIQDISGLIESLRKQSNESKTSGTY